MLAYSVVQRTREIGLRMALGAAPRDVLRAVIAGPLLVVGAGLVGALASARLMSNLLFGIEPMDPLTYSAVVVVFAGVGLLATFLPARRAMRVEPTIVLRFE